MVTLDDDFLAGVGLAELPESQRAAFLEHVHEELELRTGAAISTGMSDAQLEEFEKIIDRDYPAIAAWIDANAPDFLQDPVYQRIAEVLAGSPDADVVCEYAATKWLAVNRPDYREVVKGLFEVLSAEIRENAQQILAG